MYAGREERFPADTRLKNSVDFKHVYHRGKTVERTAFLFHVLVSERGPRIGIAIPRQWGSAVERNRMKRHLREAFRRNKELFAGVDVVVQPRERGKQLSAVETERTLLGIVKTCRNGEDGDE